MNFSKRTAYTSFTRSTISNASGKTRPRSWPTRKVARARQSAANIIARRKGVTLGGLSIKGLINERRP